MSDKTIEEQIIDETEQGLWRDWKELGTSHPVILLPSMCTFLAVSPLTL